MLCDLSFVDIGERDNLASSVSIIGLNDGLDQSLLSFTSGALSSELDGFDCFLVPELEMGDLYSAMSSDDKSALATWVSGGKLMVVSGDLSSYIITLLNGVFGWSLALGSTSSGYTASITSAEGTGFEDGPSTLLGENGNYAVMTSSLPSGATSVYT